MPMPANETTPTTIESLTQIEREVLWFMGKHWTGSPCSHALQPGSFHEALYEALFRADRDNFARLASVFPEEAAAVRRWQTDETFSRTHDRDLNPDAA